LRYAIVIEKAERNYFAYAPDLPGSIATGTTVQGVETHIAEAIAFHLEGMREDGISPPQAKSQVDYVEVSA
jgi:predicted RNase H-like HicB family nuclease